MKNQRATLIKQVMQGPAWQGLEDIKKELINQIAHESKLRDTEWETLKATVYDEGQIEGINRFFKELFNTQL